jgi:trans-aconitate 2-methyltransferase
MTIMSTDRWNPDQYKRFESERAQPFWDLAALVQTPTPPQRWLDIGCGSGELTCALHERVKAHKTLGIDSSANMLADAAKLKSAGLSFQQAKVEEFSAQIPFDVVFSNAALQWVENHQALFPRIFSWLSPHGQLAVQMPVNFDHPSHALAGEVAARLGLNVRHSPVLAPEAYAELLWKNGLRDIQVFVKVYLHPMASARQVIEWTKGTLLTYYEKQLSTEGYQDFLRQYSDELLKVTGSGEYLYPFKRLLMYARKS